MDARSAVAAVLHELELPEQVLSHLLAHAHAVVRDADRLGLVAEDDVDTVLLRHTADSLLTALARRPAPAEAWVDVGAGAGFPGLVLACAYPETSFELLEPQQRRAGFLELQVLNLGLGNVVVSRRRLQDLPPGSADVMVTRALERPDELFPLLTRPLRESGAALVLAGPGTPKPQNAREISVRRPFVDSPGLVFMMLATT